MATRGSKVRREKERERDSERRWECSSIPYLSLKARKVCVVIGGCGFLGRHLVEGLVAKGYQVRVFDLCTSFSHEGVVFHTGDLCRKEVRRGQLPPVTGTMYSTYGHRTSCQC